MRRLSNALFGSEPEPVRPVRPPIDPLLDGTVTMLTALGIKPTPQAYTVFHTHLSGERPELSAYVEACKSRGERFTGARVAEIFERFFGAEVESMAVYEASRNVERLLAALQDEIETAGADTASHGDRIDRLNDELRAQGDPKNADPKSVEKTSEIRRIVAGIVAETSSMRMSIAKLERRVVHGAAEIADLRDDLERVQREANADPLTGIANRKVLELELKRAAKAAVDEGKAFSVMMIDVDHFKRFNDDYGHQIGDDALRLVAKTLAEGIKGRDLAARFGGEEFGLVLVETPVDGAVALAGRLRESIAAARLATGGLAAPVRPVTVSIGVAQYRRGEPLERLIGRADRALYRAKELGRDRVVSERDIEIHGRPKAEV